MTSPVAMVASNSYFSTYFWKILITSFWSKYFNCSDLVDGCDVVFRGLDADGIAGRASEHAEKAHGLTGVTDRILAAVH